MSTLHLGILGGLRPVVPFFILYTEQSSTDGVPPSVLLHTVPLLKHCLNISMSQQIFPHIVPRSCRRFSPRSSLSVNIASNHHGRRAPRAHLG